MEEQDRRDAKAHCPLMQSSHSALGGQVTYAAVCCRMLTYAEMSGAYARGRSVPHIKQDEDTWTVVRRFFTCKTCCLRSDKTLTCAEMSGANARCCSVPQSQSASRDVWQTLMCIADSVESQVAEHVPDIFELSSVCPRRMMLRFVRIWFERLHLLTYDVC